MTNELDELQRRVAEVEGACSYSRNIDNGYLLDTADLWALVETYRGIIPDLLALAGRGEWQQFPESTPGRYSKYTDSSVPLLFKTECDVGTYIRQGYYSFTDDAFYEHGNGSEGQKPWTHTVKAFYEYPLPPAQEQVTAEGGKDG